MKVRDKGTGTGMDKANLSPELWARLRNIRHIALDMDGTIYCGDELFPETLPFLETLRSLEIGHTFLTNNSSKSASEYLQHLTKFGVDAKEAEILTSTHAAIELLRRASPETKRLFVVGTAGFCQELEAAGFQLQSEEEAAAPDAILIGFDTNLNYQNLCKAAYWVAQGAPYYASHPDLVCPTNQPTVLLDCGAVCAAIESATGRKPDAIAGKPEPAMLQALAHRFQLECEQIAMVGDRIYTDILMAKRSGGLGILTLTGETQPDQIQHAKTQPDLVIGNLEELATLLKAAQGDGASR